jgi:hypothetical protein
MVTSVEVTSDVLVAEDADAAEDAVFALQPHSIEALRKRESTAAVIRFILLSSKIKTSVDPAEATH